MSKGPDTSSPEPRTEFLYCLLNGLQIRVFATHVELHGAASNLTANAVDGLVAVLSWARTKLQERDSEEADSRRHLAATYSGQGRRPQ